MFFILCFSLCHFISLSPYSLTCFPLHVSYFIGILVDILHISDFGFPLYIYLISCSLLLVFTLNFLLFFLL